MAVYDWRENVSSFFLFLYSELGPEEMTTESKGLAHCTTYPTAPKIIVVLKLSFQVHFWKIYLYYFYPVCICHMYVRQMCICYMCVCHMCVYVTCVKVSMVIRKGHQMLRAWGYRWLWTNCVWVLATKLRSFTRTSQKAVLTSETSLISHFTPWLFKVRNLSLILNLIVFPYCLQMLK